MNDKTKASYSCSGCLGVIFLGVIFAACSGMFSPSKNQEVVQENKVQVEKLPQEKLPQDNLPQENKDAEAWKDALRQEKEARYKAEREKHDAEAKEAREQNIRNAIKIEAADLLAEYEANEVAADIKYKDKFLEVDGTVDQIKKGVFGNQLYFTFKSGKRFDLRSVQCFFGPEYEESLASLKSGFIYKIRGRCEGLFGNVLLKDCEFVDSKKEEEDRNRVADEQRKRRMVAEEAESDRQIAVTSAPRHLREAKDLIKEGKAAIEQERYADAVTKIKNGVDALEQIIKTAPETNSSTEATKLVDEVRGLLKEQEAEADAAQKLRLAQNLDHGRLKEQAKEGYREVIKNYPKTKVAKKAKELLDKAN